MRPNRFAIHNFFAVALSLAATLLLTITAHAQNEWFVDVDGPGGNGMMWETAFNNFQDALVAAAGTPPPATDIIRVAQGTYVPTEMTDPPEERSKTFLINFNFVTIEGGYKGCPDGVCENPEDRDIEQYETILSGDLLGNDGPEPFQNSDDNAYHVVKVQDVDASVRIDGCTIAAGNATLTPCPACPPSDDDKGGGILVLDASPIVDRCTIKANQASDKGGGMAIINGSPLVDRCTIEANQASLTGGGMAVPDGNPTVIRCIFTGNSAPGHGGGAINVSGSSHPTVFNSSFIGNSGGEGGAIHLEGSGAIGATVTNSLFIGNIADGHGGAIDARVSADGMRLFNCTLSGNLAGGPGGGIHVELGPPTITNCILWDNSPDQIGGGDANVIYSNVQGGWDCPAGMPMCGNIGQIPMIHDPRFFDPDGVDDIPGNEDDDYHLLAGSPCIDRGNPEQAVDNCGGPGLIPCDEFDLDGDTEEFEPTPDLDIRDRVVYGGEVPGPIVDMGAYEHCDPQLCPWDLNDSCDVGILDLLALLAAWGTNPGGPPDFNGDGDVGILDLLILLANWGPCPAAGGVAGASFDEELANAGLSQADWEAFKECMSTGTHAEQDNCLCWMQYYLDGCDGGPRQACSDHDPFTDCVGDLNGDCCVDRLDAAILLNKMGPCPAGPGACLGDLNGDCVVDKSDHRDLLTHFGACPSTQLCPSPPPGCGTTTTAGLEEAVTQMGFAEVTDYQAHISATSEGEAFVCACVLQVLLEVQP